jgi:uncharacterized tellurite resistance protein B-like protein
MTNEKSSFSNKDYFHCLAYMALADGVLQDQEKLLLKKYASRLDVSESEMTEILKAQTRDPKLPMRLPTDKKQRQGVFKSMCKLALADHEVVAEELKLLVRVGRTFEMDEAEVEAFVARRLREDPKAADSEEIKRELADQSAVFDERDTFRYLCAMALADGILDDDEVTLLQKFGAQLKLSPEDRQEILNQQNRSKDPIRLPEGAEQRQKLFRHVSKMALADEVVAAEEFEILARVGKSAGMTAEQVEELLKKDLKKQVRRTDAKSRAESSRRQSIVIKIVVISIVIAALITIYSFLQASSKSFDVLRQSLARLDDRSALGDYKRLEEKIEKFKARAALPTARKQALDLISQLKDKREARARALIRAAEALADGKRSGLTWRAQVEMQLELIARWRLVLPRPLDRAASKLRSALRQGDIWGQWGRRVLREADPSLPDINLHKVIFKASKRAARQPITLGELRENLKRASGKETAEVLLLIGNIRYHPYLKQGFYRQLLKEALELSKNPLPKDHEDELISFVSRLRSCILIGAAYRESLKSCQQRLDKGHREDAFKVLLQSTYSQDAWFKAAAGWLKSPAGQAYVKSRKQ